MAAMWSCIRVKVSGCIQLYFDFDLQPFISAVVPYLPSPLAFLLLIISQPSSLLFICPYLTCLCCLFISVLVVFISSISCPFVTLLFAWPPSPMNVFWILSLISSHISVFCLFVAVIFLFFFSHVCWSLVSQMSSYSFLAYLIIFFTSGWHDSLSPYLFIVLCRLLKPPLNFSYFALSQSCSGQISLQFSEVYFCLFGPDATSQLWLLFSLTVCLRSALQSLHKACEVARCHNHYPGSLFLTWISYYQSRVSSNQFCINEWNAMQDVESHRANSPVLFTDLWVDEEMDDPMNTYTHIAQTQKFALMTEDLECCVIFGAHQTWSHPHKSAPLTCCAKFRWEK